MTLLSSKEASSDIVSPLVIMVQMQVWSMMRIFPIQMLRSIYFYHQYAMGRQSRMISASVCNSTAAGHQ